MLIQCLVVNIQQIPMWKTRMELILERENMKQLIDGSLYIPKTRNGLGEWNINKYLDARMMIRILDLNNDHVDYVVFASPLQ